MATCAHKTGLYTLEPCNEGGWECSECGHKLGFRPDFDADQTDEKVTAIVFGLHLANIIYVSNGEMGDAIASNVTEQAHKAKRYDQYTLTSLILADPNLASHGDYWAEQAEAWRKGLPDPGVDPEAAVDPATAMRRAGVPELF